MHTKYIVECAYDICYALYIIYEYAFSIVMIYIWIVMLSAFERFPWFSSEQLHLHLRVIAPEPVK